MTRQEARELKRELIKLIQAWNEYLDEKFSYLKRQKRIVFICVIAALFVSVWLSWRMMNASVFAQTEMFTDVTTFTMPFQKALSIFVPTGVLGFLLRFFRRNYFTLKRIMDLIVSMGSFLLLSPLFLIVGLLVKIDSPGPILFKQIRVGRKGKLFHIYKFRTMRHNAELETGPVWAKEGDPRVTRLGNFLRKSHLDELPQLFNIIKGDMSLIGPRPERPELIKEIIRHIPDFHQRLEITPGITGLAQVRYAYGASFKDSARKLKFDVLYIKRMCWLLDMRIAWWTVGRILTGEGAR